MLGESDFGENRRSQMRYLAFRLGKLHYVIEANCVKEVADPPEVVKLPLMPSHVKGVMVLRGKVIPVMDARVRLDVPAGDREQSPYVIVVYESGRLYAIVVDDVEEIIRAEPRLEGQPQSGPLSQECMSGTIELGGATRHVLRLEDILQTSP